MDAKLSKGQQTRTQLVDAALQQFAANGYHGASMRQIADAAGLAVGGIYNHFSSKEEILKAVILEYHPLNIILPSLAEAQGETLEDLLRNAVQRFMQTLTTRPELLNIFMIELLEFQGAHLAELFDALWPKALAFAQRLANVDARLRPLPPLAMMRILLGALLGFYVTGTLLSKLPTPQAQQLGGVDELVTVLAHGLLLPDVQEG